MKPLRTPENVEILVTDRCNLKCKYCSNNPGDSSVRTDRTTSEWLSFFEELKRNAVLEVSLSGGEPFLRQDLRELINGIVTNKMRYNILSNGSLIVDDIAAFIASTGRCNGIQLSIDGSSPSSHDVFRGRGSFMMAIRGARTIMKHGIRLTARVTIHKHNVDDLESTVRFLLDDMSISHVTTNAASYIGLCKHNSDLIQLTVEQISRAMVTLLQLETEFPGRLSAVAGPHANVKHWLRMERAMLAGQEPHPDCGYLRSCGGVFSKIAVRADGVIVPCVQLGHIELGTINNVELRVLWQSHPMLARLRERRNIPLGSFSFCKNCRYIPYCRGNCPAIAYSTFGCENQPSPDACLRAFIEAGGVLPAVLSYVGEHGV